MTLSVRWRLVGSYVLLTLLAVILVGVLALTLIMRSVEAREVRALHANAEAVARQAYPLMARGTNHKALEELASTTAFLGNLRVRFLDPDRRVIADSGTQGDVNQFLWISPPEGSAGALVLAQPSGEVFASPLLPIERLAAGVDRYPPGTRFTLVQRQVSVWGSRFAFENRSDFPGAPGEFALEDLVTAGEGPGQDGFDRAVTVPVGEPGNPLGYVELMNRSIFSDQALADIRQGIALAALTATGVAVLIGLLVSRWLVTPLRRLSAAASKMSAGDLSVRSPVPKEEEFGQLARQFNLMAERLEASFRDLEGERNALRRFVADASHEFRTPITALRNFVELLQGPAGEDNRIREEFLQESQAQLQRLEWITHNLLDLSRLEAGLVTLEMGWHAAGDLVRSALAPYRTRAAEKGIELRVQAPVSRQVRCDSARIEIALGNLLDNAIRLAPEGSVVEVGVAPRLGGVRFWVRDSGPGIAPEDQTRIFQRFYRGPGSAPDGAGLGLSIVKSIVGAHHGQVWVESDPEEGTCLGFDLPGGDQE